MLPDEPYRGLAYYSQEHAVVFAGRESDAPRCAESLFTSNVLILHGRTGCGKSSFLRAGLAPHLEGHNYQYRFLRDAEGEFQVVRSGALPLRTLAGDLYTLIEGIQSGRTELGEAIGNFDSALIGCKSREDYLSTAGCYASEMLKSVRELALCIEYPPILVIDQAEEVFTLSNKGVDEDGYEEVEEYFDFLRRAADEQLGVKFIVSLRTEYKGQFDDLLSGDRGYARGKVKGFYLEELDEEGLVRAILRPTLTKADLSHELSEAELEALPEAPRDRYQFYYDPGVAELIASELFKSVPRGGVLPVLQVICLQLFNRLARRGVQSIRVIREQDWKRLGNSEEQLSHYLRETLQEMIRDLRARSSHEIVVEPTSADVDKWYSLLFQLVRIEPDGRATTRRVEHNRLIGSAEGLGCEFVSDDPQDTAFTWLAAEGRGILRFDDESGRGWRLGHDSLCLALQKWYMEVGQKSSQSLKLMDMNSARAWAKFTRSDLFEEEVIAEHEVFLPSDFLWDHQLPHFAGSRGFAKRLGITFRANAKFAALQGEREFQLKTLNEQHNRIRDQQKREPSSILVACERTAFPDGKPHAEEWSDILVSDIFLGNGLVGRQDAELMMLSSYDGYREKERFEEMLAALKKIICHMADVEATVLCYDKTGKGMVGLAADLCGVSKLVDRIKFKYALNGEQNFTVTDPLFEEFDRRGKDGKEVFLVGTALGRAIATQSGYDVYFTSQHLTALARRAIEQDKGKRRTYFVNRMQGILLHTLWQVGVAPAMWNEGPERSFVLRLASIGYFTAEYIRSYPSDFVGYLQDWLDRIMGAGGLRLGREVITENIEDCFNFLTFDEYSRVVFDLDNEFAYFPMMGEGGRSVARDIYLELVSLRGQTVAHFESVCRSIQWLRGFGELYDVMDSQFNVAWKLKERAWRHYRIYNFYDAERIMGRAAELLSQLVEGLQTGKKNKCGDS